MDDVVIAHPTKSEPIQAASLRVLHRTESGDEALRFTDVVYWWTDHGTLMVDGRRQNGYDAPKNVVTEFPACQVTVEYPA